MTYTRSKDMTADVLTKALPCPQYRELRSALGVLGKNSLETATSSTH
jgi:hypothetical protein